MLELKQVTKNYGHVPVLRDISLSLTEPGIYCLLGRNGAGKTTLLRSIAGYLPVTGGSITIDKEAVSPAALEMKASYIENFAMHFNLPVRRLLNLAGQLNPEYDQDFALGMMDRFELDGRKKFKHLSLGMKTMLSTIICLASNKSVVLLDEPVLGFDALMRVEFYEMLTESYRKHPRIIIVSTHIIEEIARTIDKLIIIDRGRLVFFDTLEAVEKKAFSVSGLRKDVEKAVDGLNIIGWDGTGGLATAFVYDQNPGFSSSLEVEPLSLQDFFIQLVGHKGGNAR